METSGKGDGFPFGTVVKKYMLMLRQKEGRPKGGRRSASAAEREREREKAGRSFGFIAQGV